MLRANTCQGCKHAQQIGDALPTVGSQNKGCEMHKPVVQIGGMSAPVLTGTLQKGVKFRRWPAREVSVSPGVFTYSRDSSSLFSKSQAPEIISVPLHSSIVGEAPEMKRRASSKHSEFVFKLAVEGEDKIHYFAATSREEMGSWITAIGQCGAKIDTPNVEEMVQGSAKSCPFTRIWVNTDEGMLSEAERLLFADCKTRLQQSMVSVGAGVEINTWTNVDGDGKPPLVLMHGWGASCAFWYRTVDLLSVHHKLYIADWVGFGRSTSLPYEGRFCQEAENYWLLPFDNWTRQLGLDTFALAGHSLGGYLCCKYAVAHPQKVRMLILVSPGGTTLKFATIMEAEKHRSSETVEDNAQSSVAEVTVQDDHEEHVADDALHSIGHHGDSDDDHSNRDVPVQDVAKPPPPAVLSNPRVRDFVWNLSPSGLLRKLGPYGRKLAMRVLKQRWGDHTSLAFTLYTYHMFVRGGGHPGEDATRHIFKPIALPFHPLEECAASLQMPSLWLYGAMRDHKMFMGLS